MKKLVLTEKKFKQFLTKILIESEEETDNYIFMTGDEYKELLRLSSWNSAGLMRIPKFKNKKIVITTKLDLSGKPIKSLDGVVRVDGPLSISNTNIADISNIAVKGWVSDYGTPIEAKRKAKERREKLESAEERREDDEWNLEGNIDDEGLKANALFNHLVGDGEIEPIDEEEKELLNNLKQQSEELNKKYKECEEDCLELLNQVDEVDDKIQELEEKNVDVYYVIPTKYGHYKLDVFEVVTPGLQDKRYAVGDEDEISDSLRNYYEEYIESIGRREFILNYKHLIENNIDKREFENHLEQVYDEWVRDSPDSYFNDDDYELTSEQEARQDELENYIEEMENLLSDTQDEQRDIEDSDSEEYQKLDEKIKEIETNIETAQEELDGIEPLQEPTEEMIENKVKELVEDGLYDPVNWFRNLGYDEIPEQFIDMDGVVQDLYDQGDYGDLNSYDGSYDTQEVNGKYYYIMRIE
jgi:hypothetical protein